VWMLMDTDGAESPIFYWISGIKKDARGRL
jgi:hypothetical protein